MALIYDLGMHRAEDTRYYLWQGHSVLAIEPNPLLVKMATIQLRNFIDSGLLTILSTAVSDCSGTQDFWIPSNKTEWGSLNRRIAEREGPVAVPISVPVVTLEELVALHGVPHYLKIDVEASDKACLNALTFVDKPTYISVETECLGATEVSNEASSLETLHLLANAGYKSFQLIDQYTLSTITWESLRPARAHGRDRRQDLARRLGWGFPFGSSGPWGQELDGEWISLVEARNLYLAARSVFFSDSNVAPYGFWCDWHARMT